ncbi:jg2951, partial [Pararge aegeria aegeria]
RFQENSCRRRVRGGTHTLNASLTPSPSISRSNDGTSGTAGTSENAIISTLLEFMQSLKRDNNSERFPVMNVIPEFDPSKRNQTIHTWISKVNECASIYGWTDKQIAYYALPKLVGLAQRWYQGLPSVKFSWSEWENKLALAFPSEENFGQLLTEMLACKARFNDSLEEYFYDKMVLLNRCKISGKDAIDCILFGIEDRSVRTSAEAAQFREPDKLLVYLRNVKANKRLEKSNITLQASTSDKRVKQIGQSSVPRCYNCGEEGHPYFRCKQPIKKCEICHRIGHVGSNCAIKTKGSSTRSDTTNNKSVSCVYQNQNSDEKYYKNAVVEGRDLNCFIDFGSQCTMLKESVAKCLGTTWSTNDLPVLRGFGNSLVNCLGKCSLSIKVDSVSAQVDVLIVPDSYLRESLLIGQTFTEQDHVVVYKTKNELKLLDKCTQLKDKILVFVSELVTVKDLTEINVHSVPVHDGDILVESSVNQQKKYQLIECITKLQNGKGKLIVKSLDQSGVELQKNTLLVRAQPCKEIKTLLINRIGTDTKSPPAIITKKMINTSESFDKTEELASLLNQYRDCFAFQVKELGCVAGVEMNINLKDFTPVVYRPYRLSYSEREVVRDMVNDLKESGIIRDSKSEYASPILLVKKKTGDYRLCVDFRNLNKKTIKEHYPLPRIDDQLDNLSGYKYYTTLDLASGYYQIPMSETSKYLTAFITPDGHFEFNRMPFGLANAPSTFQRAINNILGNARFKEAFAYMDDVIIPSKTIEEGFQRLISTLELFRKAGLTLKLSKCNFFKESIDYLGFEVCENGIRPGKNKIAAVENFPVPTDQHKLRQFLGLASFFRRFIRGFSMIAQPLTRLLKKDVKWQ